MTAFTGEIHPLADVWPMLPDDELAALAESIRLNGLRDPIVVDQQDRLIDGRNRLVACRMAGVQPTYVSRRELDTDDAVARFIGDRNAERRHLTSGQQAAGRALMLAAQGKRKNGRWERGAISDSRNMASTEREALSKAGFVLDWAPDLLTEVLAGTLALDAAHQSAKAAEDEATAAEREAKHHATLLADLRTHRPDLAALVDEHKLPLGDALDLRRRDAEKERKRAEYEAARHKQFNSDLVGGFLTIESLRHPEVLKDAIEHYQPLSREWTADDLRSLGALLIDVVAENWKV